MTGIEWTDATWNPATGCSKVSPGCKNCYAEKLSVRLKAMKQKKYQCLNRTMIGLKQGQGRVAGWKVVSGVAKN